MHYYGLSILRGVAAFFIVGCHLGLAPRTMRGEMVTWLCDMNVGLFAAISGFLMSDQGEQIGRYVRKRAGRLLPAYVVWSIVYIVATAVFDLLLDGGRLNERYYSLSNWMQILLGGGAAAHLWFLICLLYGQIAIKVLMAITEKVRLPLVGQRLLFLLVSVFLLWCSFTWANWYCIYPARLVSFLLLGNVLKASGKTGLALPLMGVIVMMAFHIGMREVLPGFLRDYLTVIPLIILFASGKFHESKIATVLGATSFGVYLVHPLFARGVSFVFAKFAAIPYNASTVLVVWLLVWVMSQWLVVLLKKMPIVWRFMR